jgi:hypothetical protein
MSSRFALPLLVTLVACGNSYPVDGHPFPPPGCLEGDAGEACVCPERASFCRAGLVFDITCVDGIWEQTDAWCDPSSSPRTRRVRQTQTDHYQRLVVAGFEPV